MKKSTFLFCLLLIVFTSNGQDKKFGISLQVSSPSNVDVNNNYYHNNSAILVSLNLERKTYSGGILLNYYLNNKTLVRIRFGMTKYNITTNSDGYANGIHYKQSGNMLQTITHIAPGIIWKLNENKFNIFGGFEIPINIHGKYTLNYNYLTTDSLTGIVNANSHQLYTLPNGYTFGIGALIGFNYLPAKWFSIGAEFSPSVLYAKFSGETKLEFSDYIYPQNSYITSNQGEEKGFTFYEQRFSINVGFWF